MARVLVLIVFLFGFGPVGAATCFSGSGTNTYGTEAAACDALAAKNCGNAYFGNTGHVVTYSSGGMCYGKCTADNLQREQYFGSISTSSADACTGDGPDCSSKPTLGSASTSWIGKSDSSVACIGGCAYSKSDGEGYWSSEHKVSVYKGKMSPLGGACAEGQSPVYTNDPTVTGAEPTSGVPSDTPKPDSCKPGQVPAVGTVNGKSVPYCAGADKSVVTSTSQKDAVSSASSPSGASSGSKSETETKTTTCSDGKCTTTTTKAGSTDGGAGAGGTSTSDVETKTESQADYCKDNPAQPICKQDGDSFFGGSCGAFSCDGDAVQCAIAREQHQRNCQLFEDRTPMTEIGEGAAGAGNRPSDHPGNNPDDIDVGARMAGVARENPFGDGCPRDFDLAVMGNVVTVPLSNACDVLKLMGEIAVAFAFIAAARIVMSGVSSGAT